MKGIACRRLYTPTRTLDNVIVKFDGSTVGLISESGDSPVPSGYLDARSRDLVVVPGLVDVHIHGCAGFDFFTREVEGFRRISMAAAAGGATSIVATVSIPADDGQLEEFAEFMRLIRECPCTGGGADPSRPWGARILGVFLEGPFINMNMRGGFGRRYVQAADIKKAARILSLCEDLLLKITIAPEIEGGEDLVRLFHENPTTQIEISLGHSAADFDCARRFFGLQRVRQVTHAFNAMHPFHHRDPGLIGAALLDDRVWMELIPDGYHLQAPAIELAYRMKGAERLMVITDATAATGTPPGTRILNVDHYTTVRDGTVRMDDGGLAGSNLFMADALSCAQRLGGIPFGDALRMCTLTPAESVNRSGEVGSVEPGKRADFCVLKGDCSVAATIRDGLLIYACGQPSQVE